MRRLILLGSCVVLTLSVGATSAEAKWPRYWTAEKMEAYIATRYTWVFDANCNGNGSSVRTTDGTGRRKYSHFGCAIIDTDIKIHPAAARPFDAYRAFVFFP